MKTIVQIVVIVWIALALEINAWKYEYAGILIVPLGVLCLFGIWLTAGGGSSERKRLKAWGRMFLGFGTFGIGAVLHVFVYRDWDVAVRESLFSSWEIIACVGGVVALLIFVVTLMHKIFLRNFQNWAVNISRNLEAAKHDMFDSVT